MTSNPQHAPSLSRDGPNVNSTRVPFSRPPFPGPLFQAPFSRPPFPGPLFQAPFSRPPFPGPLFQAPFSRPPFPGPLFQAPFSRPPFPGPLFQAPFSRPPFPGPLFQAPFSRPPFPGPRPLFQARYFRGAASPRAAPHGAPSPILSGWTLAVARAEQGGSSKQPPLAGAVGGRAKLLAVVGRHATVEPVFFGERAEHSRNLFGPLAGA